jgi:hypothetical protein
MVFYYKKVLVDTSCIVLRIVSFIPLSGVYLQLFLSCYISPCNVARMSFNYHMFEIDIKVITKWYIVLVTHGKIASNVVLHLDIIMK